MKLTDNGLLNRKEWEDKGYKLPEYDREKMIQATKENPFWVHFGAGNIFRAFQANCVQNMLNKGELDRGLVAVEGFDYEIIEKQYRPHDNLSLLVTLKGNGSIEKTVVGSIAESCILDSENETEYSRLKEIFSKDSLQMVTFTITEKGYSLVDGKGNQLPSVTADFEAGPAKPQSYIGKVVSLLYTRYLAGKKPVAMVSMDNCSHNGDTLFKAVNAFAEAWTKNGKAEQGFAEYIRNPELVSFPWTMIDKITPRPDASVQEILKQDGLEDLDPVITSKNTYVAPFVNAEETEYLVIEDKFPNGRPELEKCGFLFTNQETVDRVEKMKVCTCLNPLHTALAVTGCLLGHTKISDEMKDPDLVKLVEIIGYKEGLPVVVNPGILDPKKFIDTVLQVRVPNPFMPDTPQRIATDTSQKLPIRFGETVKAYMKRDDLSVDDLKCIPFVFAAWLRYLTGIDDAGNAFTISSDPLQDSLKPYYEQLTLGEHTPEELHGILEPVLKDAKIFGVDLTEIGMDRKVTAWLADMLKGPGAVRAALQKAIA
ncbi:MAG: mannitol dehydrogenase family protein [Solobacterium sp.]|nr:mannitol dehydrogenase family protein [Solobacterium sp.]